MSLRDFNNAPFSDDPTALHTAPSGNGVGLESFHTVQPEDIEPNNMSKIVGAVAVALMVGVAGVALYAHSGNQPKPAVVASNLPAAEPAPAQQTAMAPDANMPATPPAAETPAPAAAMAPAEKTPAPVKSASIAKKHVASETKSSQSASTDSSSAAATRLSADSSQSTVQPQQQQQQAVTQPTAPQPSPSDVATNNTQSGVAVPSGANTASDIPATPPALQQPVPSANPAPEQQPAPTQPSGQAAQ